MIVFNNEYDLNVNLINKTEKDIVRFMNGFYKILPEDMLEDIRNNLYEAYNYTVPTGIFKLDNEPESLIMARYQTAYDPFMEIKFLKIAESDFKLNEKKDFAYLTTRNHGDQSGENNYVFSLEKIIEKSKESFYVHVSYNIKTYDQETTEISGKLRKFPVELSSNQSPNKQRKQLEF